MVRRFEPRGDSLYGATYTDTGILLSRQVWAGDIWVAERLFADGSRHGLAAGGPLPLLTWAAA